jgi:hypothetical protein
VISIQPLIQVCTSRHLDSPSGCMV